MMMPIYADLLRLQAIEFNDTVRRSGYSFEIINNRMSETNKLSENVNAWLDGKLLELQADEFVTAVGTLETLPDGEMHGDEVSVSGIGLTSAKNVSDKDKWYGKLENKPSIDVEKSSENITKSGDGNNSDKDNNLDKGDADTKATAIKLGNKDQAINFRITNNGAETLTHIKVSDKKTKNVIDDKKLFGYVEQLKI